MLCIRILSASSTNWLINFQFQPFIQCTAQFRVLFLYSSHQQVTVPQYQTNQVSKLRHINGAFLKVWQLYWNEFNECWLSFLCTLDKFLLSCEITSICFSFVYYNQHNLTSQEMFPIIFEPPLVAASLRLTILSDICYRSLHRTFLTITQMLISWDYLHVN